MIFTHRHVLAVIALACVAPSASAFQAPTTVKKLAVLNNNNHHYHHNHNMYHWQTHHSTLVSLLASNNCNDDGDDDGDDACKSHIRGGFPRRAKKWLSRIYKPLLLAAPLFGPAAATFVTNVPRVRAATPMLNPKQQQVTPLEKAIRDKEAEDQARSLKESKEENLMLMKIQTEQGPEARKAKEKEIYEAKVKANKERIENLEKLQRDLLYRGICPFVDPEGVRDCFLLETGIDMAEIVGTPQYMHQTQVESYERRGKVHPTYGELLKDRRRCVQLIVQDLKNRGIDPLPYFRQHTTQIQDIYIVDSDKKVASRVAAYEANMEKYGQIVPPKEGEKSAKELMAERADPKEAKKAEKAKADAEKAAAKAKKEAEKAAAKAKKEAEKAAAKAEKEAQKAAAKAAKEAEKAANQEAKAVAKAASKAAVASSATGSSIETTDGSADTTTPAGDAIAQAEQDAVVTEEPTSATAVSSKKSTSPVVIAAGSVLFAGAAGAGFMYKRNKDQEAEAERQRQFKLLMGEDTSGSSSPASAPALEEVDTDLDDFVMDDDDKTKSKPTPSASKASSTTEPESTPAAPKKKRRGFFGKKKNEREVDLNNLVLSPSAKAPEFAKLLAKLLTFGAPGRFPNAIALPGDMPMESYDFETATAMLIEAQAAAGITKEESAEIFANVVNCMLIEIVDLASSSLKEKDDEIKINAMNVVVDFMNHAASLYNAIAEGIVITPVTYGGDLKKNQLEQMYTLYALQAMKNLDNVTDDFADRTDLLREVFNISEQKAQGFVMSAMQKNMMEMMKTEEGRKEFEDLAKNMGGMEGLMGGMPGMGGDMEDPEQVKQMLLNLKAAKDAGQIPESEMKEVRKSFKEAFGSSIDDMMKKAGDEKLSGTELEILDLMKEIMEE